MLPTAEQVTNKYLYGTEYGKHNLLSEDIILHGEGVYENSIDIDAVEYMSDGAGRFVNSANFYLIEDFFESNIPAGVYGKNEIAFVLGHANYGYSVNQVFLGVDDDDHAERSYIWGSTKFKISDGSLFVVNENGEKYISNFSIVPNGDENFDFSGGPESEIGNSAIEPIVDLSGIGRAVDLKFFSIGLIST